MSTLAMAPGYVGDMEGSARGGVVTRRLLLWCGAASTALYVATDVLGGLRYPGYSFWSQTISELAAVGAPTERFVDPLFFTFDVLALAFAVGVLLAAGGSRALLVVGALLAARGVLTLSVAASELLGIAPTTFAMQQRGAGSLETDMPHIVLMLAIVWLLLLAMSFGAFALGRRFRLYSFATIALVLVLGAVTGLFVTQVAAGGQTPGLGIVERVMVYASVLWPGVLGIALLRRPAERSRSASRVAPGAQPRVEGMVAPGFEEVREEFEKNFTERGEIGAAVAAYWRGEKVVDLWGGRRTPDGDEPWRADTMIPVMSTTKGLAAMTLAVANARGWLDYDAPVARYWPEFAQNGKEAVTVRQLLGHEAGLVLLDEELDIDKLRDLDYLAGVLARQKPAWPPGTAHGYHTLTIGLYMQELIRHVDPEHRSLGRFFREEIALPLGLDFYIGVPREIPDDRLAKVRPLSRGRGILALRYTPPAITLKMITPGSLLRRSFLSTNLDMNERPSLELELPAGNGVGTARAIARAYSAFAEGGAELGITPETMARVTEPYQPAGGADVVLGVPSHFSLGFLRPGPDVDFGTSERAFGAPGAGGSFGFADPDAHLGYAYVMNKLDFYIENDPREKPLRDAVYRAIARRESAEQHAA